MLAKLCRDVLGIQEIGLDDNFFHLGGQSLMAVTLVNDTTQVSGKRLALQSLLKAPTIRSVRNCFARTRRRVANIAQDKARLRKQSAS
jgi:gramicidin S synthase 2/tyrocidine synthetase-3